MLRYRRGWGDVKRSDGGFSGDRGERIAHLETTPDYDCYPRHPGLLRSRRTGIACIP